LLGSHPFFSVLFWAAVYAVLALVIPQAQTPAEQAAAHGGHNAPRTAQEFIKRARAGYYEGMKTWQDKDARREWKRKFKRDLRGFQHHFARDLRRSGDHVSGQWHQHWGPPSVGAVAWVVLPVVSLLQIVLVGLWILAVFSLVNTGAVFGHPMLATMPFWKAMVVLAVVYFLLSLPLRAVRGAALGSSYPSIKYRNPAAGACTALVWLGSIALAAWLLVHHPTEIGRAAGELSAAARQGFDAILAKFHQFKLI